MFSEFLDVRTIPRNFSLKYFLFRRKFHGFLREIQLQEIWILRKIPEIFTEFCPHSEVDEKNKNDDDEDESNREVKDREKRPEKPAKRRLSEPKPICTINPNVKKVSPKAKKAKSTSASKEK